MHGQSRSGAIHNRRHVGDEPMEETNTGDPQALAEIEQMKANPAHPMWADTGYTRALYLRAYPPPGEEPKRESGAAAPGECANLFLEPKPATEQAEPAVPDCTALAQELGVPEKAGEILIVYSQLERDPETQRVMNEIATIGLDFNVRRRYFNTFFEAVFRDAKQPPDPEASVATLRAAWGKDYDQNLWAANYAVNRLDLTPRLQRESFWDDPTVIMGLAEIGQHIMPAREAYLTIMDDREHPARDSRHPRHESAREELEKLRRQVYG
jgi:hypothetical protein